MKYAVLMGIAIFLVGVLDVVSTELVLGAGGSEQNPLVLWVMERAGHLWIVPKIFMHTLAGFVFYYVFKDIEGKQRLVCAIITYIILFSYLCIITLNFSMFLHLSA